MNRDFAETIKGRILAADDVIRGINGVLVSPYATRREIRAIQPKINVAAKAIANLMDAVCELAPEDEG